MPTSSKAASKTFPAKSVTDDASGKRKRADESVGDTARLKALPSSAT